MDPQGYEIQCDRLAEVIANRDNRAVIRCLADLSAAARRTDNLMPFILDAVKAYATLQEIMDVFREVFGEYREPNFL